MNPVEIEQAISELAEQPFDSAQFPFQFLAAFGHKEVTLKKLRSGHSNASDVQGGVLLRNHIHLAVIVPNAERGTRNAERGTRNAERGTRNRANA